MARPTLKEMADAQKVMKAVGIKHDGVNKAIKFEQNRQADALLGKKSVKRKASPAKAKKPISAKAARLEAEREMGLTRGGSK